MHLLTNARTGSIGGTIREYVITFNLFLKKALQWVSRWIFDLVSPSEKIQEIPSLFREDNGLPRDNRLTGSRGGIYIVIRYLSKLF